MIGTFGDSGTEALYDGHMTARVRRFPPDVRNAAVRKLDMIAAAHELGDLASPPGNRLEALRGDLQGHYSIRVNDQWRLTFRWEDDLALDVTLRDYHR
ncbi:MAG: type II toxin-antitoxin system RelE/ParE family toxin [Dehalococcoidia bacterium]